MDNYNVEYSSYHLIYTHQSGFSIYLGDLHAASNLNFIHSQNIATVITAALGMDQLDYSQMSIKHIVYPLLDSKRENISLFFENFCEIVEKQIRIGSILVHCSAGISRSPTLVIAYLMKKEGWVFKEAIEFIRSRGRKVIPNLGFQRQLKTYESILHRHNSTLPQKKPVSYSTLEPKKKYNRPKLQSHLPSLKFMTLLSNSVSPMNYSPEPFAIGSPRRQMTHHIRRSKLTSSQISFNSTERKRDQTISASKNRKNIFQSNEIEMNNFQVQKVQINQRVTRHKKIRSKIIPQS